MINLQMMPHTPWLLLVDPQSSHQRPEYKEGSAAIVQLEADNRIHRYATVASSQKSCHFAAEDCNDAMSRPTAPAGGLRCARLEAVHTAFWPPFLVPAGIQHKRVSGRTTMEPPHSHRNRADILFGLSLRYIRNVLTYRTEARSTMSGTNKDQMEPSLL